MTSLEAAPDRAAHVVSYHSGGEVKTRLTIGLNRQFVVGPCCRSIDEVASSSYIIEMRSVGLKVLKNKLSEYVRLAAAGETVLVTDRDRVVAELVPPQPGRNAIASSAVLAQLVREGLARPATIPPGDPLPPRKPVMKFAELMKDIEQDREDR
jgi:antitoxin (DNA-binding transcriptional repressor) of toxin-antitoxin stability system